MRFYLLEAGRWAYHRSAFFALNRMDMPFNLRLAAFVFLLVLPSLVLAQGDVVNTGPERLFILPQGFTASALSGAGPSLAFGVTLGDAGRANPAALAAFDGAAVGLAYQLETSVEDGWLGGISYEAANGVRPQSAAAVVPVGAWAFGLSYQQRYAATMDFGEVPYQTIDNPEVDPSATFDMEWASRLTTVAPQVAYRASLETGELALGLRVGFGYGQFESEVRTEGDLDPAFAGGDYEDFSDWGTQVAAGVSYRTDGVGLALYYESALRIEGTRAVRFIVGIPVEEPDIRTLDLPISDAIPARVAVSGDVEVQPGVRVGADVARVFWKDAWPEDADQMRDQIDASAWTRLRVSESGEASLGLIYQGRGRWGDHIEEAFGYSGRALYFTLGGALTFDRFRLDAVVADSRLLSAEEHRQTVIKLGASVRL